MMHIFKIALLALCAGVQAVSLQRFLAADGTCLAQQTACAKDASCAACFEGAGENDTYDFPGEGCGYTSIRKYLGGDFLGTDSCRKDANTSSKALSKMMDCYAKELFPPLCENGLTLSRCKAEFDACEASESCKTCKADKTPEKDWFSQPCEADTNETELKAEFDADDCAENKLLGAAITCVAKAYATDCRGVKGQQANAAGALSVGAAAVSAVIAVAASLIL